jgi:hypothetical protein
MSFFNQCYFNNKTNNCLLPILKAGSFANAVSEEKIILEIRQSETRIAYGSHIC